MGSKWSYARSRVMWNLPPALLHHLAVTFSTSCRRFKAAWFHLYRELQYLKVKVKVIGGQQISDLGDISNKPEQAWWHVFEKTGADQRWRCRNLQDVLYLVTTVKDGAQIVEVVTFSGKIDQSNICVTVIRYYVRI